MRTRLKINATSSLMSKQKQTITPTTATETKQKSAPAPMQQLVDAPTATGLLEMTGSTSLQSSAQRLSSPNFLRIQRQLMAGRIGHEQGNGHLQSILGHQVIQRDNNKTAISLPELVVTGDAKNAEDAEDEIQQYINEAITYFSLQYLAGINSFKEWYEGQEEADVSLFNGIINVFSDSDSFFEEYLGMTKAIGPIGALIALVAEQTAKTIQQSRDDFASSLITYANNFAGSLQRKFMGKKEKTNKAIAILNKNRQMMDDIHYRHALNEDWQSLLHEQAGVPRTDINYQARILANLILKYKRWEISRKTELYQNVYKYLDPNFEHLRRKTRIEAYLATNDPIPRYLHPYATEEQLKKSDALQHER